MDSLSKHGAFSKNTINLQFYAHGVLGVVEAFVSDKIQATPEEIAKDLEKKDSDAGYVKKEPLTK